MTVKVTSLDHLVLTVADLAATQAFYETVLGMVAETFAPSDGSVRRTLAFGCQKINLHLAGREFEPKAEVATAGSADLCFLSEQPISVWLDHLRALNVEVVEGPVRRTGAQGPIMSIYLRDPDGNLIEVSNSVQTDPRRS